MTYDHKNKTINVYNYKQYLYAKTRSMFDWDGLPETIPQRELEKILQENGVAFIYEVKGDVYAFSGSLGGELDVYGNFTTFSINNHALDFNKIVDIKDGVLIKSDSSKMGLNPLFERYSHMLNENDITLIINGYNTRMQIVISASDDKTKVSAEKYLNKIIEGELGVIGENTLFDGVKTQGGVSQQNSVKSLIEYQQYLKASLYNEIGINANFNMKRERLNTDEVDMIEESIFPFVDNMLDCRNEGCAEMAEKYNIRASVSYGSIWKDKRIEISDAQNPDEPIDVVSDDRQGELPLDDVEATDDTDDEPPVDDVEATDDDTDDEPPVDDVEATDDDTDDVETPHVAPEASEVVEEIIEDVLDETSEELEKETIEEIADEIADSSEMINDLEEHGEDEDDT